MITRQLKLCLDRNFRALELSGRSLKEINEATTHFRELEEREQINQRCGHHSEIKNKRKDGEIAGLVKSLMGKH